MGAQTFTLGGRVFRAVVEHTVAHDVYFMGRVRLARLDSLDLEDGEPPEAYAHRLLGSLMASDKALEIIGALIVPEKLSDLDWSPEVAAETAAHVGRIHDPTEKAAVQTVLLSVLIPFLQRGLGSLMTTRASSDAPSSSAAPSGSQGPSRSTANGAI